MSAITETLHPSIILPQHTQIFLKNLIPRIRKAGELKIWQRLCAAMACLETYERAKEKNIDKFAYCESAYRMHAKDMVQKFSLHLAGYDCQ
jgi:hypothetical protein